MDWLKKFRRKLHANPDGVPDFAGQAVILSQGDSASIRYLLYPHLRMQGFGVHIVDPELMPPFSIRESNCRKFVISRYLPRAWVDEIKRFRAAGGCVVYFMDDDLMDRAVLRDLPAGYARKIDKLATSQFDLLTELCVEFWVGSQYLASKYSRWQPIVLEPRVGQEEVARVEVTKVCYHGTASHQAELKWIGSMAAKILKDDQSISLEVFGDASINKLFRDLPQVSVVHPMNWNNYLAYTRSTSRDIGLAPLLPGAFNKGRGPTKFFDYTRMGAVGIYTDVEPYRGFIRDGVDGILLPNEPVAWEEAVFALAKDPEGRQMMAVAARQRAHEMTWDRKNANKLQMKTCDQE